MASGIRRVRGRNGLRARDAAHGHMAVVAVIFVWTVFIVFIVVVHVHVVLLVTERHPIPESIYTKAPPPTTFLKF